MLLPAPRVKTREKVSTDTGLGATGKRLVVLMMKLVVAKPSTPGTELVATAGELVLVDTELMIRGTKLVG